MSLSVRRQTLVALVVLGGLTLLFFRQVIFSGMIYAAPDVQAGAGALAPLEGALEEGTYPLWNPYVLGGMPSYASMMWAPYATPAGLVNRLLNLAFATPRRFDLVLHFLLAGLGAFVYLRWRGAGLGPALLGGLAFEFSVHLVGMVAFGHNNKLMTIAYLPWALWASERLLARPSTVRAATLALVLGLQLLTAHPQMAYYTWLAIALYTVYWLVHTFHASRLTHHVSRLTFYASRFTFYASRLTHPLALLLAALLLGLALSAVLNLPVANYSRYSIRGGLGGLATERAGQWSLPPWELLTFLLPHLFGFGGVTYWGGLTFADFPHYAGAVTLALAALAIAQGMAEPPHLPSRRRDRSKSARSPVSGRPLLRHYTVGDAPGQGFEQHEIASEISRRGRRGERAPAMPFLALLALVSALLACGSYLAPLFDALRLLLPLYNKFRAPVQALVLAEFALAALAGLGLQAVLDRPVQRAPRRSTRLTASWLLAGAGGLIALAVLATVLHGPLSTMMRSLYPDAYAPDVQPAVDAARSAMLLRNLWTLAFLLGSGALLLWSFLGRRLGQGALVAFLVTLVVVDLWRVGGVLNHPQPRTALEEAVAAGEVAQFLQADPDLFRILPVGPLFADNRWAAHYVFTAGGYRPAKLRLYQEFLDGFELPGQVNPRALALLNVKYVLSPWPLEVPGLVPVGRTALAYGGRPVDVILYRNAAALPRAWLVGEYRLAEDGATALAALQADDFDPAQTVVLVESPPVEPRPGTAGRVEVLDYRLHEIALRVQADTPRLLVLSEVYYPQGWRAYVDGQEAPILRANHVLRAVALEAGQHRVAFHFEPWDVRVGLAVSIVAALVIAAGFGASLLAHVGPTDG